MIAVLLFGPSHSHRTAPSLATAYTTRSRRRSVNAPGRARLGAVTAETGRGGSAVIIKVVCR